MFRRGGGGGVVAVFHPVLWIAACSSLTMLTGCGGLKFCPIASSSGMYHLQSHFQDYQHFADLGAGMVWCRLDGGGGLFFLSLINTTCCGLPWTSPWHFQVALSQATALLEIALLITKMKSWYGCWRAGDELVMCAAPLGMSW